MKQTHTKLPLIHLCYNIDYDFKHDNNKNRTNKLHRKKAERSDLNVEYRYSWVAKCW